MICFILVTVGHCEHRARYPPCLWRPTYVTLRLGLLRGMNAGKYLKFVGFLVLISLKNKIPVHFKPGGLKLSIILHLIWKGGCTGKVRNIPIALRIFCHPKGSALRFWMFAEFLICSCSSTLIWASVIWERIPSWWGVSEDGHFWGLLSEAEGFQPWHGSVGLWAFSRHRVVRMALLTSVLSAKLCSVLPNCTTVSQAVCGDNILLAWGQDPITSPRLGVYLPLFMWEDH